MRPDHDGPDELLRRLSLVALDLTSCYSTASPADQAAITAAIDTLDGIVRSYRLAAFLEATQCTPGRPRA